MLNIFSWTSWPSVCLWEKCVVFFPLRYHRIFSMPIYLISYLNCYIILKESYDKSTQHIKKQRHHFANKGPYSQSYGSSSSHVQMGELDQKEG